MLCNRCIYYHGKMVKVEPNTDKSTTHKPTSAGKCPHCGWIPWSEASTAVDEAVIETVRGHQDGLTPRELWSQLDAYPNGDLRDAVARLHDDGELDIGPDRRLRATGLPTRIERNVTNVYMKFGNTVGGDDENTRTKGS